MTSRKELLTAYLHAGPQNVTQVDPKDEGMLAVKNADGHVDTYVVINYKAVEDYIADDLRGKSVESYPFEPRYPILKYIRDEVLDNVMEIEMREYVNMAIRNPAYNEDEYANELTEMAEERNVCTDRIGKDKDGKKTLPMDDTELIDNVVEDLFEIIMDEYEDGRDYFRQNYNIDYNNELNEVVDADFETLVTVLDMYGGCTIDDEHFRMDELLHDVIDDEVCNYANNPDHKTYDLGEGMYAYKVGDSK